MSKTFVVIAAIGALSASSMAGPAFAQVGKAKSNFGQSAIKPVATSSFPSTIGGLKSWIGAAFRFNPPPPPPVPNIGEFAKVCQTLSFPLAREICEEAFEDFPGFPVSP